MSDRVDIHLDWLRYTIPYDERRPEAANILRATPTLDLFKPTGETVEIGQGYNHGLRLQAGMLFWNSERHEQGVSVQLAGHDLQELRHSKMSEQDMLQFVSDREGRVSTLHSCINLHDCQANVHDLIDAHDNDQLSIRARQVGVYASRRKDNGEWATGETFYIGSAKSSVQVRVYNKAAEQGIKADWTRIEIVWRGKQAQAAHQRMLNHGIEATTRGAIQHHVSAPIRWWSLAMAGELAEPEPIARKETGRYLWLKNVALPALRKEIDEEDRISHGDIRALFADVVCAPGKRPRPLT